MNLRLEFEGITLAGCPLTTRATLRSFIEVLLAEGTGVEPAGFHPACQFSRLIGVHTPLPSESISTARPGLEPELEESKSSVLPLDHKAICVIGARGIEPPSADRKSAMIAITLHSQIFGTGNERIRTSPTGVTISRANRYTTSPVVNVVSSPFFIYFSGNEGN